MLTCSMDSPFLSWRLRHRQHGTSRCRRKGRPLHRFTGALYNASGWTRVGTTQGRGRYDRHTTATPDASLMQTMNAAFPVCLGAVFLYKQGVVTSTASRSLPFRTSGPRRVQDTTLSRIAPILKTRIMPQRGDGDRPAGLSPAPVRNVPMLTGHAPVSQFSPAATVVPRGTRQRRQPL